MKRGLPRRTRLSLVIGAALVAMTTAAPAPAQTLNYNGSQSDYDQLVADPVKVVIEEVEDATHRSLVSSEGASGNTINVTDTDNLVAAGTYNSLYRVYGGFSTDDSEVSGNTVTIDGGTITNYVIGGYTYNGTGNVYNNTVTINGGALGSDVYGGFGYKSAFEIYQNTVIVNRGTITGSVYGAYNSKTTGNVYNNTVTINGGTITGSVYGAYIVSTSGNNEGNTVNINGGSIGGNVYGTYRQYSGIVTGGTVNINGGSVDGSVYGGYNYGLSVSETSNNSVTISGGSIKGSVYGAYKRVNDSSSVSDNTVTLAATTITGSVYGGYNAISTGNSVVMNDNASVAGSVYGGYGPTSTNNSVVMNGNASVTGSVYGGSSGSAGTVSNNSVTISGGSVGKDIYGGHFSGGTGTITDNSVTISGGSVGGSVFGGYSSGGSGYASSVTGNTVSISGGSITGNVYGGYKTSSRTGTTVTDNTVTLTGGTVTGGVYGGYAPSTATDTFTGNTLNVANASDATISVGSVQNFETLSFDLSSLSGSTAALTTTGDLILGSSSLDKSSTINLAGVNSTSATGAVLASAGGSLSSTGTLSATAGGESNADFISMSVRVEDNNLLADYTLSWVASDSDAAHGTFTLTDEDSRFTLGVSLSDNENISGTNAEGWDGSSLTKAGAGTLILAGDNTYTGGTTISAGTLQIGNGGTTGSVMGDIANNGTLAFNRSDELTYTGVISGTGSVEQKGAGTTVLTGNNTYTGGTTVSAGTLKLGTENAIAGTSGVTVAEGATLNLGGNSQTVTSLDNSGTVLINDSGADALSNVVTLYGDVINSGTFIINNCTSCAGQTLAVDGDWTGNGGTVSLGAVLGGDSSLTDKLAISGSATGTTYVTVRNEGGSGAQTLEGIEVITTGSSADEAFVQKGRIVAGSYEYSLRQGTTSGSNTNNWYLTSTYGGSDSGTTVYRPERGSYASNLQAAGTMFNTRLKDRQAGSVYVDPVTGERSASSVWMRAVGGHGEGRISDGQSRYKANRMVFQMGGDVLTGRFETDDAWSLGVMGGYGKQYSNTRNDLSGYRSKGQVWGYSAGLYGTWYQNAKDKTGLYVDSWLLYNWFDNAVKGDELAYEKYKSKGITASIESGYAFHVGAYTTSGGMENNVFVTPQAQVLWSGVQADNHTEQNGTRVQGRGSDNVQTRAGVRLSMTGQSLKDKGTVRKFEPFVEANWVYTAKQYGVKMGNDSAYIQGSRNVAEIKAGVEGRVSENLSVWTNVAQQMGEHSYRDTQGMLGLKYAF